MEARIVGHLASSPSPAANPPALFAPPGVLCRTLTSQGVGVGPKGNAPLGLCRVQAQALPRLPSCLLPPRVLRLPPCRLLLSGSTSMPLKLSRAREPPRQ